MCITVGNADDGVVSRASNLWYPGDTRFLIWILEITSSVSQGILKKILSTTDISQQNTIEYNTR